jgi:putative CocE/NonD family hydrolase
MKKRVVLASLALLGAWIYRYRRSLLARLLNLPPPRCAVGVERDLPVVMPDGVRLFTDHYLPKMAGDWPTILIRTPYGRGKEVALGGGLALAELPGQCFAERGYHVVVQGVRGCYDSEGEFQPHHQEAADGQATVDWIARQPWFNGVLGTWGPSYLGYTQWAVAASAPSTLKAMLPAITSAENYSIAHLDGAFALETRLRWAQGVHLQKKLHHQPLRAYLAYRFTGDAEQHLQAAFGHLPLLEADTVAAGEPIPFYRESLVHTQPADAFWTARDHSQAVAGVTAAVHLVGGWYDYFLRGLLRDYAALQAAGRRPYLTVGPWYHAQAEGLLASLREGLAWFDAQLKGEGPARSADRRLRRKPVRLYVMGADEWREMDDFPPPARPTRYYLHPGASLATDPPPATSAPDGYRYDPADPTPALGGALLSPRGAGPQDNGPLEARADVLCYTTQPLGEDVQVMGPVRLELYVRSNRTHTDFFGRLCDVAPDGPSINVCDGLFRVEPGNGQEQPDGSLRLEIDLGATACRFRRGHRLRLQVSSGAHPRWSRNLGTGEALATGTRMVPAEQTIYHDAAHPSALVLPVG